MVKLVVWNSVDGVFGAPSLPTVTQATAGEAFSYSVSFTQGDALVTTAPSVGAVVPFHSRLLMLLVLPEIWQVSLMLMVL